MQRKTNINDAFFDTDYQKTFIKKTFNEVTYKGVTILPL